MEENEHNQNYNFFIKLIIVTIVIITIVGTAISINKATDFVPGVLAASDILKIVQVISLCASLIFLGISIIVYLKKKIKMNNEITNEEEKNKKLKREKKILEIMIYVFIYWFISSLLVGYMKHF